MSVTVSKKVHPYYRRFVEHVAPAALAVGARLGPSSLETHAIINDINRAAHNITDESPRNLRDAVLQNVLGNRIPTVSDAVRLGPCYMMLIAARGIETSGPSATSTNTLILAMASHIIVPMRDWYVL